MVSLAYIFPGQGAQYVGMGKDLYQNSPAARGVFEKADQILGFNLTDLCFNGPLDKLSQTINAQPAVLAVNIAGLQALQLQNQTLKPKLVAGLSLGEYSALVAAKSLSIEDSLVLVRKRAQLMSEASLKNPGKMAAIIGLSEQKVEEICRLSGSQIANLNSPGQIVVSGTNLEIENVVKLAGEKGAKRTVILKIEGPYHCHLMDQAAEGLGQELAKVEIAKPRVPIVANVTGACEDSPQEIKSNLKEQLTCKTLWEKSIHLMISQGITNFVEIGPGKVLKGLLRRIDQDLKVYNVEKTEDLDKLLN
ncbi:MAG: ACP S-malonyltransferase [Candidatus Omnitrophota bacterium]|nr:ACP S-malonyltransferase [Candidatus Omnitrophota bacterium]